MRIAPLAIFLAFCAGCQHPRNEVSHTRSLTGNDPNEVITLSLPEFERALYFFQTTVGALRNTPHWKPKEEFPPLSPRKAETAARLRAEQMRPDVRIWFRDSISLHETEDKVWYYLVRLSRGDQAVTGLPYFLDVPVLMDGRALTATTNAKPVGVPLK